MPLALIVIGFGVYMGFIWVLPLFHARLQLVAKTVGARLFVVGPTHLSRRFLIITEVSVPMLTSEGRLIASWPSDQVAVTSVRQFANSVGLLLVADDRFFEIPIAHAVGGAGRTDLVEWRRNRGQITQEAPCRDAKFEWLCPC